VEPGFSHRFPEQRLFFQLANHPVLFLIDFAQLTDFFIAGQWFGEAG